MYVWFLLQKEYETIISQLKHTEEQWKMACNEFQKQNADATGLHRDCMASHHKLHLSTIWSVPKAKHKKPFAIDWNSIQSKAFKIICVLDEKLPGYWLLV